MATYRIQNIGADNDTDGMVLLTRVSDGQQVLIQNDYINTTLLDNADGSSDNAVDFDAIFQIGLDNTNPFINEVIGTEEYTFESIGADNALDGAVIMTRVSDGQQVLIQNDYINTTLLDNADGSSDNSVDFDAIFQIGLDNTNPFINEMNGTLVVCFARGTLIKAQRGEVPIEELKVGDKVLTVDAGYQPIRWMGVNKLSKADLDANPKLKPIRIRADALGPGMPKQDLLVSPQHRVLVRSAVAQRMFGVREVLIPAKKLLDLPGIDIAAEADQVEYFHMLFDDHQLVWSNGAVSESLFTGPEALKAVSPEAREEIATLFPDIMQPGFVPKSARFIPATGRQMQTLTRRIAANAKWPCELPAPLSTGHLNSHPHSTYVSSPGI